MPWCRDILEERRAGRRQVAVAHAARWFYATYAMPLRHYFAIIYAAMLLMRRLLFRCRATAAIPLPPTSRYARYAVFFIAMMPSPFSLILCFHIDIFAYAVYMLLRWCYAISTMPPMPFSLFSLCSLPIRRHATYWCWYAGSLMFRDAVFFAWCHWYWYYVATFSPCFSFSFAYCFSYWYADAADAGYFHTPYCCWCLIISLFTLYYYWYAFALFFMLPLFSFYADIIFWLLRLILIIFAIAYFLFAAIDIIIRFSFFLIDSFHIFHYAAFIDVTLSPFSPLFSLFASMITMPAAIISPRCWCFTLSFHAFAIIFLRLFAFAFDYYASLILRHYVITAFRLPLFLRRWCFHYFADCRLLLHYYAAFADYYVSLLLFRFHLMLFDVIAAWCFVFSSSFHFRRFRRHYFRYFLHYRLRHAIADILSSFSSHADFHYMPFRFFAIAYFSLMLCFISPCRFSRYIACCHIIWCCFADFSYAIAFRCRFDIAAAFFAIFSRHAMLLPLFYLSDALRRCFTLRAIAAFSLLFTLMPYAFFLPPCHFLSSSSFAYAFSPLLLFLLLIMPCRYASFFSFIIFSLITPLCHYATPFSDAAMLSFAIFALRYSAISIIDYFDFRAAPLMPAMLSFRCFHYAFDMPAFSFMLLTCCFSMLLIIFFFSFRLRWCWFFITPLLILLFSPPFRHYAFLTPFRRFLILLSDWLLWWLLSPLRWYWCLLRAFALWCLWCFRDYRYRLRYFICWCAFDAMLMPLLLDYCHAMMPCRCYAVYGASYELPACARITRWYERLCRLIWP